MSIAVKGHNPRRIYLDAQTPVCNRRVYYGSVRILRIFSAVQFDGDIGGSVRYRFFERPVLSGKIGEFCRADTQCVLAPRCDAHRLILVLPHEGVVFFPEFHRRFLQFLNLSAAGIADWLIIVLYSLDSLYSITIFAYLCTVFV